MKQVKQFLVLIILIFPLLIVGYAKQNTQNVEKETSNKPEDAGDSINVVINFMLYSKI